MSLQADLEAHLQRELGDTATAGALADYCARIRCLARPGHRAGPLTTLFAFTFGNRMLPNGNREPGPVNGALADIVATLHRRPGRVFSRNGRSPRRWPAAFRTRW